MPRGQPSLLLLLLLKKLSFASKGIFRRVYTCVLSFFFLSFSEECFFLFTRPIVLILRPPYMPEGIKGGEIPTGYSRERNDRNKLNSPKGNFLRGGTRRWLSNIASILVLKRAGSIRFDARFFSFFLSDSAFPFLFRRVSSRKREKQRERKDNKRNERNNTTFS